MMTVEVKYRCDCGAVGVSECDLIERTERGEHDYESHGTGEFYVAHRAPEGWKPLRSFYPPACPKCQKRA